MSETPQEPLTFSTEDDVLDLLTPVIEPCVWISRSQLLDTTPRRLFGRHFPETGVYNVFPEALDDRGGLLGMVLADGEEVPRDAETGMIYAMPNGDSLAFFLKGSELKVESYGLYQDIFSRNSGILETDAMRGKHVVILGCGSVGSLVALELARAGVGSFFLADADVMEYHNLCRHQCGIEDVGDYKVNAVRRRILQINPMAEVATFNGIVQNAPKDELDAFCADAVTLFVGCADNRNADVYANRIASYYGASFLSIGFWERAFAGELFYHIPSRGMPCYRCALGTGTSLSARAEANHHVYSTQEDLEALSFEPGISVDINYITTIGIKLAIDILCESDEGYRPRLLGHLSQYTLACNTSNPLVGGEMVGIFSYPLQVTTSLVVGFNDEECTSCGRCRLEMTEEPRRKTNEGRES